MMSYDIDSEMYILGCTLNNKNGDYAIGALDRFLNAEDEFSKLAGIPTEYLVDNLKENLTNGQFMSVTLSNDGVRQRCIEWVEKWQKPEKVEPADLSIIPEEIWIALAKNGLIQREPLKWIKSDTLLAFFIVTTCNKLKDKRLKHGEKNQWQPFGKIFQKDVKKLQRLYNGSVKRTGASPLGHEIIAKIFKDYKK